MIHKDKIPDSMKSEEPRRVEIPISTPSISPPDAALNDAKISGAPPPNAKRVTPAKLSDILKVCEIHYRAGLRYSSAVKLTT